jgi:uncharacterized membrane protein
MSEKDEEKTLSVMVLLLVMTVEGWVLSVDYWLLTVDCRLSNECCGTWTSFWEKMRAKENIVCYGAVTCDDCWVLTINCWLVTVDCWLSTVECMLWDMNFVLGKDEGKGKHCLLWCCHLWWLLTVDCRMHVVGHELRFGKRWGKSKNIVCYGVVAGEDCWLSTACCGTWTSFWGNEEGKTLSVMVLSLVMTVDCWVLTLNCWLLTVDYWLSTVDCRMHVVGHELRFGKRWGKRKNIVCYGAVTCDDCWLLTVDYWRLTVDCWLSNACCGT